MLISFFLNSNYLMKTAEEKDYMKERELFSSLKGFYLICRGGRES